MQDKTELQAQMLVNRLKKRFKHLKKWAQRTGTDAFRLYDRDIPEIPLVLDFYSDCICGSLYKRPYEKDEADEIKWLSAMKDSITAALGIKSDNIYLKQRQKQKGASQYEKLSGIKIEKIIKESSLSFKVNLSDYLDTGLFIDRRLLRAMVRSEAFGKKVLNLFSYTGSFSVYAAAGRAALTDSIDLSNTYLDWAKENFSLNGLPADIIKYYDDFFGKASRKTANTLLRADVLDFLDRAVKAKMHWDIIILDPPSFSNSKKMSNTLDLNRDLTELVCKCLKLLLPGGKIYLSINLRQSVPSSAELEAQLRLQLPQLNNIHVTDLGSKTIDEDFKDKKTPKSFLICKE